MPFFQQSSPGLALYEVRSRVLFGQLQSLICMSLSLQEDYHHHKKIGQMVRSLSIYNPTLPGSADAEKKPTKVIGSVKTMVDPGAPAECANGDVYGRVPALRAEHLRSALLHPSNMDRRHGWDHPGLLRRLSLLLSGTIVVVVGERESMSTVYQSICRRRF